MAGSLNGSLVFLLLKVLGQWRIIGGQVSHTDTINNNPIDITNKSSQDYRELLEGEGLQSRDISLEIYYNSDSNYKRIRELSRTRELGEFRILRSDTGVNDDVKAVVSSFSEVAPMGDRLSNTITLTSSEPFGDAGPMPPIITLPPKEQNVNVGDSVNFITRAINWTSVQWYKQKPPVNDVLPPREPIDGATEPDLVDEFLFGDRGSHYIVVYSNQYGTAEAIGTVNPLFEPVALTLLYPIMTEDSISAIDGIESVLIKDVLGPQSTSDSMVADYGFSDLSLRQPIINLDGKSEKATATYGVTSLNIRDVIINLDGKSEKATATYGVTSLSTKTVIVTTSNSESVTATYNVNSMEII